MVLALSACGGGGGSAPDANGVLDGSSDGAEVADAGATDGPIDAPIDAPSSTGDGGQAVYRQPVLAALMPATVSSGGAAFVVEATGEFDADAVVLWDQEPLTTRVTSGTKIVADVAAARIALAGQHVIQVLHAGAGGALSPSRFITVVDGPAMPMLARLLPASTFSGTAAFSAKVQGWNFTPTSVVSWNGTPRVTTFVSSIELGFSVTTADLATGGTAAVTVTTPGAAASGPLTFTIDQAVVSAANNRISVTPTGAQSTGVVRQAIISANGRYVVFSSTGADLVSGDANGFEDVFIRDTCLGATGCTPSTTLVSAAMNGGSGDGASLYPAVSATGRYVAFQSRATNLVAGDVNAGLDVFVRDTCAGASGCTPSTIRASLRADGGEIVELADLLPEISANGRWVSFLASAPDIVPGDLRGADVYLRDTCIEATGCTPSTIRVSENLAGEAANVATNGHGLSPDGRYVLFHTSASNLVAGTFTNLRLHLYLKDTCAGATACTPTLTQIDVPPGGGESNNSARNRTMAVSLGGRYVAFSAAATNLTPEVGTAFQLFHRDTCIGATGCTPSTTLVSRTITGTAGMTATETATMTPDGRYVVFRSNSPDLVASDTNNRADLFVRDMCTGASGCTPATRRVSMSHDNKEPDGDTSNERPAGISADGRQVVWASAATNLVTGDTNNTADAFLSSSAP